MFYLTFSFYENVDFLKEKVSIIYETFDFYKKFVFDFWMKHTTLLLRKFPGKLRFLPILYFAFWPVVFWAKVLKNFLRYISNYFHLCKNRVI